MTMKRKIKTFLPVFLSSIALTAASPEDSSGRTLDRIAAVVGEKVITLFELQKAVIDLAPSMGYKTKDKEKLVSDKGLETKVLYRMIDEMLIDEEIAKRGIEVTDPELDMFIQTIMAQNRLKTYDELKSMLALQGQNYDEYRSTLRKQIEKTKIMNTAVRTKINISEEDLKNYYMQNLDAQREPDLLHLKNIFIASDAKDRGQKLAKAKDALQNLKKGERFENVAKRFSDDPNARSGGDLGFMTEKDLNRKIYSEVSALKAGETTGIVEVANGFYILKLTERKKGGVISYEDAKEDLRNKLMSEELEKGFANWLSELRSKTYIDIKI